MIELAVEIKKGEGRKGMLSRIDMALILGGYAIKPGIYRVIIEPANCKNFNSFVFTEEEATNGP